MNTKLADELRPFSEAAKNLRGWEFEYRPEPLSGDPPWDYESLASELLSHSSTILDLGTGGGEVFSRILERNVCNAFAIEEWQVNAPVAQQRLGRSVPVVRASSGHLPFRGESFDLVLSRHEAIEPEEITRVLKTGGCFLTQQVIHDFMWELREVLPDMTVFPHHYLEYQEGFADAGLSVKRAEEFRYKIRFNELGHLVYQLVATPWTVPEFDVDSHLDALCVLDERLKKGGELLFTAGYYLMEVQKDV